MDDRNPRTVTNGKLPTEDEIIKYFFGHDDLARFLEKIGAEGKNQDAAAI